MTVLVFDLGGGTFDVSIVRISPERFETIATDGDVRLGGRDWDERLVEFMALEFKKRYGCDPRGDAQSLACLFQEAEHVKHALSARSATRVLMSHDARRLSLDLTRAQFDKMTDDLLLRTQTTTELVVENAGLTWPQIDRVLLVGGMTRIPQVREMIKRVCGREPDCSLSADEVVAHGAALHGGMLAEPGGGAATSRSATAASRHRGWMSESTDVNSHSSGDCRPHARRVCQQHPDPEKHHIAGRMQSHLPHQQHQSTSSAGAGARRRGA